MISLLHPSRGRPEKSFKNLRNWMDKSGAHETQTEVVLSLDANDPFLTKYLALYRGFEKVLINDNTSVVEATNRAADQSIGDILIYLSDDFDCPDNWWELVTKEFDITNSPNGAPQLLKVDDCLQGFHVPVLTIPIMNRELYNKLGYFWHPGYKSMFCDEHLYWMCKKLNCMKMAPKLKFPHLHCSVGKSEHDDTYRRSERNWDQGKALFALHKSQGFPL